MFFFIRVFMQAYALPLSLLDTFSKSNHLCSSHPKRSASVKASNLLLLHWMAWLHQLTRQINLHMVASHFFQAVTRVNWGCAWLNLSMPKACIQYSMWNNFNQTIQCEHNAAVYEAFHLRHKLCPELNSTALYYTTTAFYNTCMNVAYFWK